MFPPLYSYCLIHIPTHVFSFSSSPWQCNRDHRLLWYIALAQGTGKLRKPCADTVDHLTESVYNLWKMSSTDFSSQGADDTFVSPSTDFSSQGADDRFLLLSADFSSRGADDRFLSLSANRVSVPITADRKSVHHNTSRLRDASI